MKLLAENKQHLNKVLFACFNNMNLRMLSGQPALPNEEKNGGEYI